MPSKNFIKLIFLPELKLIAGKYYRNFYILCLLLFISIISLAIGNSIIDYLRVKMDSPFIKFINVVIPWGITPDTLKLMEGNLMKRYLYDDVTIIYDGYSDFNLPDNKLTRLVYSRQKLYSFITNPSNDIILTKKNTFNDNKVCVIITEAVANELGYSNGDWPSYIYYNFDSKYKRYPIPVAAVVKQLPDKVDVLISNAFFKFRNAGYEMNNLNEILHKNYLRVFIPGTSVNINSLDMSEISITESFVKGRYFEKLGLVSNQDSLLFNSVLKQNPNAIRIYKYDLMTEKVYRPIDNISFSFHSLDSIRPFQSMLFKEHKLTVDMDTIEAKENFNFFNKLSSLLSIALILFSIIALVIFLTNTLVSHFDQNKKSFGTLKAFGLSNSFLILFYSIISLTLIIFSLHIVLLCIYIIGSPLLNIVMEIFNINVSLNKIKFNNYPYLYYLVSFLVLPTLIIFFTLKIKLGKSSPGDLIYGRED